ncbi:MAG: hypothetical protein ACRYFR_14160 [Janthinobacterium lividum]
MTLLWPSVYALGDGDHRRWVGTKDPFAALAKNPDAELQYLVELYPYNDSTALALKTVTIFPGVMALGDYTLPYSGGEVKERLSDHGFITAPTDTDPNRLYLGRVTNPLQFDSSILSGGTFSGGSTSYGGIDIVNADGELDRFWSYHWAGRQVVVKAGGIGFAYDDFSPIFSGSVNSIDGNDSRIVLTIRDNRIKTDKPVRSAMYGGTGSLDGMAALTGQMKPLAYGVCKNVLPVLVEYATQTYQLHDGSLAAVDQVRDRGIILTYAGDVADIRTANPGANQYVTQLSGGYMRLGSTPAGQITADVQGDNADGFTTNSALLALKILKSKLGVYSFSSADIDEGSFARVAAVLMGAGGLYIDGDVTGSDVLDALLNNSGAYWTFTRQGMLFAGIVRTPDMPTIDVRNIDIQGLTVKEVIPPAWRITVGYAPATQVQSETDLAGGVTSDVQNFVTQAYRTVTAEDSSVRQRNALSNELVFNTNLASLDDAKALLARLVAIYSVKRTVYQVTVYNALYRYFVGDTANLVYDRYGLSAGKPFLVVGISENAASIETTLELWG